MQITLNGEPYSLPQEISVSGFVGELQLNPTQVAIERNLEIVPRSLYDDVVIVEGDNIEIVTFIGGG